MHWIVRLGVLLLALTISAPRVEAIRSEELDGISFADDPHMLFVPVEEIALALRWEMQLDQESWQISLNGHLLDPAHLRKLTNRTLLVPLDELQRAGATITWSDDGIQALVASDHKKIAIPFANKRVEVDLSNQRPYAYQGARLVLDSASSTGREGKRTPSGEFKAGQSNRGCTGHRFTTTHRCRGVCRCTRMFSFTDSGRFRDVPPRTVVFACR
jgi:hypothetical protein